MRSELSRRASAECARCAGMLEQSLRKGGAARERRGAIVSRGLVSGPEGERQWQQVRDDAVLLAHSAAELARWLGPFGSPERIAILIALYDADSSAQALCEQTGLTQGQLYHHIKDLIYLGYAEQQGRNLYRITPRGSQALITVAAMADDLATHP